MTVVDSIDLGNPNSLVHQLDQLQQLVQDSARTGRPILEFETQLLATLVSIGHDCVAAYLKLQGDGDLGPCLDTPQGRMTRSDEPRPRELRTLFGEHVYHAFVYGRKLDRRIDFRPVDVRMELDESKYSPRFQEISQLFCVEQAFGPSSKAFEAIFGARISVNSLERINRHLSESAESFLFEMPIPAAKEEGEILVVSGDGKGVPMVRERVENVPAFDAREHPGNRQMATLATVYSVDRWVRTPEQIVDALFRENGGEVSRKRPEPVGKAVVGCLTRVEDNEEPMPGDLRAFTWAAEQVERRHQAGQPLVRLMDGQVSLWNTANWCLGERPTVDILDLIHVSSYVWKAAKILESHREHQEAYTRDWLLRIVQGKVGGVIATLRQSATRRKLSKQDRRGIERICGYFAKNRRRMRYHEYLERGYPIATGVIEGACRHLVMDRLCRTGMRWKVPGSQAMLNLRAIHQADRGREFHDFLALANRQKTRDLRHLLKDYIPFVLCG
jgi:hypothetical protein